LAVAATIDEFKLSGKVVLFGTPAEEGGGGKIRLLDAGAYSDHNVDVSLMAHPGNVPDAALVRTAAYTRFKVEYFGKEAHAAASPWEGVSKSQSYPYPCL
jgi:metal-dependent amidase/aminoacylase/carboxypeptidase family protein